jgi:DnaD/phage-associated family protein
MCFVPWLSKEKPREERRHMARSRNIKPGFFLNDKLAEIEPIGRLLFAGLWTIADREGRLEDRSRKIKAEILPYDECNVDEILQELHEKGFILRYEVNGERYIWIRNFQKHQNPHKKETSSVIPPPTSEEGQVFYPESMGNSGALPEKTNMSPADSLKLIPDSLNLIPDSPQTTADSSALMEKSISAIEKEFGRPLSPMEIEQVQEWERKHATDVILHALKIAVLNGVYNFKYINTILMSWEKANLQTIHQVLEYEKRPRYKGKSPPKQSTHVGKKDSLNWLYEC